MGLTKNYDEALILAHGENFKRMLKERLPDIRPEGYGGLYEWTSQGLGSYILVDANRRSHLGLCRKKVAVIEFGNDNAWIFRPNRKNTLEIFDSSLVDFAHEYAKMTGIGFEIIDCSPQGKNISRLADVSGR